MVLYTDSILLIDRTNTNRTLKTGSDGVPNGDLSPWRIRLELVNTGEDGVDNSGSLKLRIDENKTFLKTGPLFMQEDAKKKFLIECKISQTINGATVIGKTFMFQIGTPSISVDAQQGAIMTIQLQEIQRRLQEVYTSKEMRFVSAEQAVDSRLNDFQNYDGINPSSQNSGLSITLNANAVIPKAPELEYVPQTPITIKKSLDDIFSNMSESTSAGGVFTDYYYDFDPDPSTPLATYLTANKIGAVDSGAVIDPLSADAVDSEQQQDANTDFFKYRNHVIGRGNSNSGSLPVDHSNFSSNWIHSRLRPEWNSAGGNNGSTYSGKYYLKGMVVKRTFTFNSSVSTDPYQARQRTIPATKVIRFFMAVKDVTSNADPTSTTGHTFWKEDFILYPKFERTGHYEAGDVVYYENVSNVYSFYQATEDIFDWSLNRFRYWQDPNGGNGTYPLDTTNASGKTTKHLKNSTGFLLHPNEVNSGFDNKTVSSSPFTNGTPAHARIIYSSNDSDINGTSSFTGWEGFNLWTSDVFDWEKNMACTYPSNTTVNGSITTRTLPFGASAGTKNPDQSATNGYTSNRYVGLMPDWNMAKDVYEKQDVTDAFENISMKWVHGKDYNVEPAQAERYHGQRVVVSNSPSTTPASNPFIGHANQIAQYFVNNEDSSQTGWKFSKSPENGDVFNNLDDGRVYQWNSSTSAYEVMWKISKDSGSDPAIKFGTALTPFHIVKDIYKTKGFDGTPNSAVEVRYALDADNNNHTYNEESNKLKSGTQGGRFDVGLQPDKESVAVRRNSRGAWLWFWLPFPRIAHSDDKTVAVGDKYGGSGNSPAPASGFTTLNIFNNSTDSKQSLKGWNTGTQAEDMGRISSLTFRIKVGVYALESDESNDDFFWEIPSFWKVVGEANIPMTFWCIDIFDRIWTHKFTVRKNTFWDEITIPVGDMSRKNLHIPRFDELVTAFGDRPLGFTNFMLPEKEYTGVAFDWRFVKGFGIQSDMSYDKENGYYNGGLDYWLDRVMQLGESIKQGPWNIAATISRATGGSDVDSTYINNLTPQAWTYHNQMTIALDDVHFDKELVVNSSKTKVDNARTSVVNFGNITDKITLKNMVASAKARLSFFPQFWHIRSIGDVRLRVGQSFKIKGDRMPNMTDMDGVVNYNVVQTYSRGDKVSSGGYVYQALQSVPTNTTPPNNSYWENLNELACSEVRHIIDHTGYHTQIQARRKFILTGED